MKYTFFSLIFLCSITSPQLNAMEAQVAGNPMNAEWFYEKKNPFASANKLHQEKNWDQAENEYLHLLEQKTGSSKDQSLARLNLAACQMAQRKATEHWAAYDDVIGISSEQKLPTLLNKNTTGSVLVQSSKVGIGDIFHFLQTAAQLKEKTGLKVILSTRGFLKHPLQSAADAYGITLISDKEEPETVYKTHLISLLGHLKCRPADVSPKQTIYSADEQALARVSSQIEQLESKFAKIGIVFLGENRQATLIGGKQLPQNSKHHGRHLTSPAFIQLLQTHQDLTLIDCGNDKSRLDDTGEEKERIEFLAKEENPFDTFIALGRIMSKKQNLVGFGADNGPTNVFSRSLDPEAQDRMAFIIPNSKEYDMRMEGDGTSYRQMISNCRIYKCATPEEQSVVVEQAFQEMTS